MSSTKRPCPVRKRRSSTRRTDAPIPERRACFTDLLPCVASASGIALPQNFDGVGALGGIRTPDPQSRSLVLYPAELRALDSLYSAKSRAARRHRAFGL